MRKSAQCEVNASCNAGSSNSCSVVTANNGSKGAKMKKMQEGEEVIMMNMTMSIKLHHQPQHPHWRFLRCSSL